MGACCTQKESTCRPDRARGASWLSPAPGTASAGRMPGRFAAQGAKVVVNDLGGARDGTGSSGNGPNGAGPAQAVVDEITAAGGEAVANTGDISPTSRGRS